MSGYQVVSLDELERYQTADGEPLMVPLRRQVGFEPFGVNGWVATATGDQLISRHSEPDGEEELYVVVHGRATFTVGAETIDAPAGTLVFVPPRTVREAIAAEEDTLVLAAGAQPGVAWRPTGWDDFVIAFSLQRAGREAEARPLVEAVVNAAPGAWQGYYNAACFEARAGNSAAALAYLERAVAVGRSDVRRFAPGDDDFASLRNDPRFAAVVG